MDTAIVALIELGVFAALIAAFWIVFSKAGRPGWASLIPLYNTYVLLKIIGRPGWWLVLMCLPIVNFVIGIIAMIDLARSFGRGTGFGIGLLFLAPIFIPILAFGGSRYLGPAAGAPSPKLSAA